MLSRVGESGPVGPDFANLTVKEALEKHLPIIFGQPNDTPPVSPLSMSHEQVKARGSVLAELGPDTPRAKASVKAPRVDWFAKAAAKKASRSM